MEVIERPIAELIFAEYNPRQLSTDQYEHLKASLKRFDCVEPVIVNTHPDRKDIIVGGHQRVRVWKDLGHDTIPCTHVNLPLEKERELNVRLNKNTGSFDWDALGNNFDMEELIEWGFSEDEIDFGVDDAPVTKPDPAPEPSKELQKKWGTELGQLWDVGPHRVYCADCREVLPTLDNADLMITDPPYGMAFQSNYRKVKHDKIAGDECLPAAMIELAIGKADRAAYVFCRWNNLADMPTPKSVLAWVKNNWSMGDLKHEHGRQWEAICFYAMDGHEFTKRIPDVIPDDRTGNNLRPTEKPVLLLAKLIACNVGKTIYDPFLGSGTTMVAAHQLDRVCYGMEIEPKYVAVILERMHGLGVEPVLADEGPD